MNKFKIDDLIGHSFEDATEIASSNGYFLRIMWKDGITYFGTCDFIENRIDVFVKNNILINYKDII